MVLKWGKSQVIVGCKNGINSLVILIAATTILLVYFDVL